MNKDRFPVYALAAVAGAAVAVWAGIPPFTLLFLLVCPLMMVFMMRGMSSGQKDGRGGSSHDVKDDSKVNAQQGPRVASPKHLDGSHERIENP